MEKKIVAANIGMKFGMCHVEGAMSFGAEIAAICDSNEENLRFAGERYNIPEEKRITDKSSSDSVNAIIDQSYTKPLLHNASVAELIEMVKEHNSVPVVDDRGCFIGIILRRDVLNFLSECYEKSINNQ